MQAARTQGPKVVDRLTTARHRVARVGIVLLLIALAGAVGLALGVLCTQGGLDRLLQYDAAVFLRLNTALDSTSIDFIMMRLSASGSLILPIAALCIYWLFTGQQRRGVVLAMAALALVGVVDSSGTALKKLVNRTRPCAVVAGTRIVSPCAGSPSFPSNHAANAFAVAGFLAVYDRRLAWAALSIAVLVSYSRVHLGVHYPLDVLAGAILGITLGACAGMVVRRLSKSP